MPMPSTGLLSCTPTHDRNSASAASAAIAVQGPGASPLRGTSRLAVPALSPPPRGAAGTPLGSSRSGAGLDTSRSGASLTGAMVADDPFASFVGGAGALSCFEMKWGWCWCAAHSPRRLQGCACMLNPQRWQRARDACAPCCAESHPTTSYCVGIISALFSPACPGLLRRRQGHAQRCGRPGGSC